jgi:hypothetical protein
MKKKCHIWPQEPKVEGDSVKVSFVVEPIERNKFEIWYKLPLEHQPLLSTRCDPFVLASMYHLMIHGENVMVHGPVSSSLLDNLEQYMQVWHLWRKGLYKTVSIDCEKELTGSESTSDEAISLLSSGLDACFTVARHAHKRAGRNNKNLTASLLVHGFNITLEKKELFKATQAKAQRIANHLSLPLIVMENNWWQEATCIADFHSTILASYLTLFQRGFRHGLLPSTCSYDDYMPWGSHPTTDTRLGSHAFEIVHDDAAFCRVDKVIELSKHPFILNNMLVCNQPNSEHGNCGKCEKCIRTAFCFMVNGLPIPSSLNAVLNKANISNYKFQDDYRLSIAEKILQRAKDNNIDNPHLQVLRKRLSTKLMRYHFKQYLEKTHKDEYLVKLWGRLKNNPITKPLLDRAP